MHPGIELRISTPAGVVVQCDSDFAHYSTTFRGVPPGQWYTLVEHFEGHPVLDEGQGADLPLVGGAPLVSLVKVELRAIELEDADVPDDARELLDESAAGQLADQLADVEGQGCQKRRLRGGWSRRFWKGGRPGRDR